MELTRLFKNTNGKPDERISSLKLEEIANILGGTRPIKEEKKFPTLRSL